MAPPNDVVDPASLERPVPGQPGNALFGSDVVADMLRAIDVPFIALNPGASYRGLHDSIVNYLGNSQPQMLLCLHEEHAVAIAHGYAKVTNKPMAVALHSNVGLMHGTMAIFNAWCDRMPIIILGATGPVDAMKRRPWIDWIHTARDQGALIRNYTKWDDQPASAGAAREGILRANWMARTAPMGPVYINLDAAMQEEPVREPLPPIDPARFMPPVTSAAPEHLLKQAVEMLQGAKRPFILMGRVGRGEVAWANRLRLAETLGARVATSLKEAAAFPTDHPLHVGAPASLLDATAGKALAEADVILSLDWNDLGGTLRTACKGMPQGRVIQASLDHLLHNGWSMDHQSLPVVDLMLPADPDEVVAALVALLPTAPSQVPAPAALAPFEPKPGIIHIDQVSHALQVATAGHTVCLTHVSLSWTGSTWPFRHPLAYLGGDGGGGLGAGPGNTVGAALALRGTGTLPIGVCGDGDYLMGCTALWTAVHYGIPLMIIVANNQSFYNDEMHQERMARARNRPIENKWIGQRMSDPAIDHAAIATAQGVTGFGPVIEGKDLLPTLEKAVAALLEGKVVVVEVRIQTGYLPETGSGFART